MSDALSNTNPNEDQDDVLDQNDGLQGDELKTKLAQDLGLDPSDETQAKILDNALKRETRQREITAKAIQQKQKYRTELEAFQKTGKKPEGNAPDGEDFDAKVENVARRLLEERDIKALGLTEELEDEVKTLAQLKKISVSEAAKLPYIQNRKEEIEREKRLELASPSGKNTAVKSKTHNPGEEPKRTDYSMDKEGGVAYLKDLQAFYQKKP